mmetsp:Transcript_5562/g.13938  ORF Transcript_5562/g.13938 Transcript_5562/m.13938 type:complete len:484 (-) Transcript_5562:45-1496(-)|eukprot:CAMPEP_0197197632 /NCGR_PEP_ID=MMETSP1423-20130617/32966_1 /TAXON_ID=476441 /ORGANISM="Pseudo-nitzschia heimii, Strain UNC1101" /LENGTH=483 /DNA_ID=CAMNT_0042651457 /DNA_START=234 /DNA_END=1685 /DNA_ORIENTATION=-
MLPPFSTQYLTPDDFSVPCRLRRYDEFGEDSESDVSEARQHPEEIRCTMRKWHKEAKNASEFKSPYRRKISESQTKNQDAELIIAKSHSGGPLLNGVELSKIVEGNTPIPLSKRFASFGTPDFIGEEERTQYQRTWSDSQQQSGSMASLKDELSLKNDITIPLNDITKVITRGEDSCDNKPKRRRKRSGSVAKKENPIEDSRQSPTICITTSSSGSYELVMESTNEQLVVVTFLKVNSKKGNILFATEMNDVRQNDLNNSEVGDESKDNDPEKTIYPVGESCHDPIELIGIEGYESLGIETKASNLTAGTLQSTGEKSFDVEAFTAKKMNERLETESISEKLERRIVRFMASLDDLASSLTKCSCGCFGDNTVHNALSDEKYKSSPPRKNTASTASLSDKVEDDSDSSATYLQPVEQKTESLWSPDQESRQLGREELLTFTQMPSGLSVEFDDHYLDDETRNDGTNWRQPFLPNPAPLMASDV